MALSARQARFVAEYLKSHNGTEAAVLAGYGKRGAAAQASRMLTMPEIVNRLTKARVNVMEEVRGAEITVARVLEETAKLAYFDADNIKAKHRFSQKVPALKILASHLGMIQPAQQQTPNMGFQINIIMGDD